MTKDFIINAVNGLLSYEELDSFVKQNNLEVEITLSYDSKKRFLKDEFICVCKNTLDGKLSKEYFKDWLKLICAFLIDEYSDLSKALKTIYFENENKELDDKTIRKIIHIIKDYEIRKLNKNYINFHKRHRMKVIYIRYYAELRGEIRYIAYIIDHENRQYDIKYLDESEIDYSLNKNYSFIKDDERKGYRAIFSEDESSLRDLLESGYYNVQMNY